MERRIRIPNKIFNNYVTLADKQNISVINIKIKKKCAVFFYYIL